MALTINDINTMLENITSGNWTGQVPAFDWSHDQYAQWAEENASILDGTSQQADLVGDNPSDFSMSQFYSENPDASWLDAWTEAAKHSDEWAEKLLDYYAEKQSLDEANAYTASREDTAYQRLVEDLRRAGLNPAMMFGSSASPSASASQGYIRQSEGANARTIGNYSKLKSLMLNYLIYQMKKELGAANTGAKYLGAFASLIGSIPKR